MEKLLYKKLKEHAANTLNAMLLLIIIMTILFISTLLTYFEIITIVEMNEKNKVFILILSVALEIGAVAGALISMIPFTHDYRLVKNGKYKIIDGVVTRFTSYQDGMEPPSTNWLPVIEDLQTGEILKIELDQAVEVGDRCTICFLPKTKIAVIKKRIYQK